MDKQQEAARIDKFTQEIIEFLENHADKPTVNEGTSALFTALKRIAIAAVEDHPEHAPSMILSVNIGTAAILLAVENTYFDKTGKRIAGK